MSKGYPVDEHQYTENRLFGNDARMSGAIFAFILYPSSFILSMISRITDSETVFGSRLIWHAVGLDDRIRLEP